MKNAGMGYFLLVWCLGCAAVYGAVHGAAGRVSDESKFIYYVKIGQSSLTVRYINVLHGRPQTPEGRKALNEALASGLLKPAGNLASGRKTP